MIVATRLAAALVITAALVSMSCSSTGSNGAGGGGGGGDGGGGGASDAGTDAGFDAGIPDAGLQQTQFCDQLTTSVCARDTRCLTLDPAQLATCQHSFKPLCAAYFDSLFTSTRTYDTAKAEACIAASANETCLEGPLFGPTGAMRQLPRECWSAVFAPKAVVGASCNAPDDCLQGFCDFFGVTCAVCRPYQAIGAPCNFAGNPCNPATSRCALAVLPDGGNACDAFAARGAVCDDVNLLCGPGDYCPAFAADGGMRTCLATQADGRSCVADGALSCTSSTCTSVNDGGAECGDSRVGFPCFFHQECGDGNYCNGARGAGVPPGVCSVRVGLGGACANQFQDLDTTTSLPRDGCVTGSCIGGLCKLPSALQPAGSECDRWVGSCLPSLYCKGVLDPQPDGGPGLRVGTCSARNGADGGCPNSTACSDGLFCNPAGVCSPYLSAGAGPCDTGLECKGLLTCNRPDGGATGLCTAWQPVGAVCPQSYVACSSNAANDHLGFCLYPGGIFDPGDGGVAAGSCAASLDGGASCARDGQCTSGRCRATDAGFAMPLPDGGSDGVCVAACGS